MAAVYLFCEGGPDGLDLRALDILVAQPPPVFVQIVSVGGERNLRSVASWHEECLGDVALTIEDRNYRTRVEAEATWKTTDNRRLMWLRHEVENYLLEPRIVCSAFEILPANRYGLMGTTVASISPGCLGITARSGPTHAGGSRCSCPPVGVARNQASGCPDGSSPTKAGCSPRLLLPAQKTMAGRSPRKLSV